MLRVDPVAQKYAKAIFEQYPKAAVLEVILKGLTSFNEQVEKHPDLKKVATLISFSGESRAAVVGDIGAKLGLTKETLQVLNLLGVSNRLANLPNIISGLQQILWKSAGQVALEVESALELNADQKKKVESKFQQLFGKEVVASYSLDKALLGGIRVRAMGKSFDGTISGWLDSFKESLAV